MKTKFIEGVRRAAVDVFTRAAAVAPATFKEDERTVEAVLSTESPVRAFNWDRYEYVDEVLIGGGVRHAGQVPFLNSHQRGDLDKVMGSIRDIQIEGKQVSGVLHFADIEDEDIERSLKMVKQGHITDVSVGYRYSKDDSAYIPAGERANVGGVWYTAGDVAMVVAKRWEMKEASLVAIGADEHAKIRGYRGDGFGNGSGAKVPEKEGIRTMWNEKQWAYLESLGLTRSATDAEVNAKLDEISGSRGYLEGLKGETPAPVPESKRSAAPTIDEDALRAAGAKAERERAMAIRSAGAGVVPDEEVQRAINENLTESQAHKRFLEHVRVSATSPISVGGGIEVGAHNPDAGMRAIEDAVGLQFKIAVEDPKASRAASAFQGIGLVRVCEEAVRASGAVVPVSRDELFRRAISTMTLSTLLGNVANKVLMASYDMQQSTALLWCGRRSVSSFHTYTAGQLSAFSSLIKIGNGQMPPSGTFSEKSETYKVETYGRRFGLTREMIVNDDLGAFMDLPKKMGAAAARNIDDITYTYLTQASGVGPTMAEDSKALFATDHASGANYKTGASGAGTSVLDSVGLENVGLLARKMKAAKARPDDLETYLNIQPEVLLVPAALSYKARQLMESVEIRESAAANGTKNVHNGTMRVVTEPRLDAGTDGATAWYTVANPNHVESIVLSFLNGQERPTITDVSGPSPLSREWEVIHDVGVSALDYRGIFRGKGAAA